MTTVSSACWACLVHSRVCVRASALGDTRQVKRSIESYHCRCTKSTAENRRFGLNHEIPTNTDVL